jgi:hypothetical protein
MPPYHPAVGRGARQHLLACWLKQTQEIFGSRLSHAPRKPPSLRIRQTDAALII